MTRYRDTAEAAVLSIGEAAAATGLSIKTIRYYEEIGLVPEAPRRNGGAHGDGHRIYDRDAIGRLAFVRSARLLGLSLAETRRLLAIAEHGCPSERPEYRALLEQQRKNVDQRIAQLAKLRETIDGLLSNAHTAQTMTCDWGSCDCLAINSVAPSGNRKGRPRPEWDKHAVSKGGNHVRAVRLQRN